jgi:hypothetical protein
MSGQIDFDAEVIRLGLPLSMKSAQACEAMDVGPTKLRELISAGEIDGRKRGRDLVVMTASILRYNANLPRAEFTLSPKKSKSVSTAAA